MLNIANMESLLAHEPLTLQNLCMIREHLKTPEAIRDIDPLVLSSLKMRLISRLVRKLARRHFVQLINLIYDIVVEGRCRSMISPL